MSIRVQVSNLGPLRSAEQELATLTILVGENNSGKTFMATVCHRVMVAQSSFWFRPRKRDQTPAAIIDWLKHLAQLTDDVAVPPLEVDRPTIDWAESFASEFLEEYGQAVREGLAYAYGIEANDLRRRTSSRRAADCFLRISSTDPSWTIQVRFDRKEVKVENVDVLEWIRIAFRRNAAHNRYAREFGESGFNGASDDAVHLSLGFYRTLASNFFQNWPRNSIHLPAGRTGIMHSYDVLAANIVQMASEVGLRPIEIAPLHGTTADFLSFVIHPARRAFLGRRSPKLGEITSQLEKEIRADVTSVRDAGPKQRIAVRTPEGFFPLSITSSMISELAPIIFVAKYALDSSSHLTIDEPESHLHPAMQRRLADFLVSLANHGVGILITTHSDYLTSEITNAIRKSHIELQGRRANGGSRTGIEISKVQATRFRRSGNHCLTEPIEIDPVDGIDQTTFSTVMEEQYEDSVQLIDEIQTNSRRTRSN